MKFYLRNALMILSIASLSNNYSFAYKNDFSDFKNGPKNQSNVSSDVNNTSSTTKKLMDVQLAGIETHYSYYKSPKNQKNDDKDGEGKNTSKSIIIGTKYKF
ncbi:MAG: hypothetical protein BGO77_04840 [Caedibacter sp. 37-49]|nr:MAG: hypothetical protein BGO77_04840 [Caedibacter sp. 37-49]